LRPVRPDDKASTPRQSNVGDGHAPSADIRVLKEPPHAVGRGAMPARGVIPQRTAGSAATSNTPGTAGAATKHAPSASLASTSTPASHVAPKTTIAGVPASQASAVGELCASLRLTADTASYAAVSAMMGEHLPLDARSAAAVRRAVRHRDGDPAAARIAARALAAGLDPEGAAAEKVLRALDVADEATGGGHGGGDGTGSGGSGGNHDGSGQNSDSRREGVAAPPGREPSSPGVADIVELASSLAEAAAAALGDPDLASLAAPGADGSGWACIPFETTLDGVNFHGFFRLWYYSNRSHIGRLVADIRFGDERRLLGLYDSGSGACTGIAYHADDADERQAFMTEFDDDASVSVSRLADGDCAELSSRTKVDEDA